MSAPDFLDTNILVYAYDASNLAKQQIAQRLVRLALAGNAVISTQVLAEFSATFLHKLTPALRPDDVMVLLDALGPTKVVLPEEDMVRRAVEARGQYGIHFYDGMIVAAAAKAGCKRVWSEDFNSGQEYFGVLVQNPFT